MGISFKSLGLCSLHYCTIKFFKIFNDKYTKLFQVNNDVNLVNELYENINGFYEDFINYIDCFRDDPDILMRIKNVIEEYSFDMIYYKYVNEDHEFIFNLPNESL